MKNKVENIVLKSTPQKNYFFIIKSQALILLFSLPIYIYICFANIHTLYTYLDHNVVNYKLMEHIVFLKLEEFSCNKKKDAASILQFIASLIIT